MSTLPMRTHRTIQSNGRRGGPVTLLAAGSALVIAVALAGGCGSSKGTGGAGTGGASTSTGGSMTGDTTTTGGCAPPCCEDDPQFPIQVGDSCVQCKVDADCLQLGFQSGYGNKCQSNGMCGCSVDNDCIGDAPYPRCLTAKATCVQCLTNADCDTTCDPTQNQCTPCSKDADCATSAHGTHCVSQQCGCATSADCASSPAGPTCSNGGCTCSADTDCVASSLGHACAALVEGGAQQCGCTTDADCGNGTLCQTTAHRCFPSH